MILRDLISEVSSLGFDGAVECDTLFLTSLKRSLLKIFTDKKITSKKVLHKSKDRLCDFFPIIRYDGENAISIPLRGGALCFFTSGSGTYTLTLGSSAYIYGFSGSSVRHAHVLDDNAKIVFSGGSPYTVSSFCVFLDAYENDSDIPDGRKIREYDMKELFDDFLSFASFPKDERGCPLECVTLERDRMYVDREYEGDIHIHYARLPKISMSASPESEVDIPREYEHLLPVLVASYIYLDSNPTLAERYRELYATMSECIKAETRRDALTPYKDTNGWA